jgi:hypothetical protein
MWPVWLQAVQLDWHIGAVHVAGLTAGSAVRLAQWRCSCGRSDCRLCLLNSAVLHSAYKTPGHWRLYSLQFVVSFICTVHNDCYCTRQYTSSDWQTVNNEMKGICKEQCGLCRVLCWNRLELRKTGQSVPNWVEPGTSKTQVIRPLPVTEGCFVFVAEKWKLATGSKKEIINFALLECDAV